MRYNTICERKASCSFLKTVTFPPQKLTDDGRMPPRAVYKESFPTGIPIPCQDELIVINMSLET